MEAFTSREKMEQSSRWFMGIVVALIMLGLVMVYSARTVKAARLGMDPLEPLLLHAVKAGLGFAGMLLMMRIDYRSLGRHYGKIWIVAVLALVLVLVPGVGVEINGARRWYQVMGFMIQPSEFAKPALIIVVAALMVKAKDRIVSFNHGFLPALIASSVICVLILVAPDFGTTVITCFLAVTLLVIGGVRIQFFMILTVFMAAVLFLYGFKSLEHVGDRMEKFLDRPEGGQVHFSLMAIASGGVLGTGLGGSHCKLNFIPECESDFIFSIIGEEMGFLGTSLVVCLFAALILHGLRIICGITNRFGLYVAVGILLLISTQALVNIAVVVGLAPTKGLPLPFISSGGSSMIALMMAVGLFLNIARRPKLAAEEIKDDFCEMWFRRILSVVHEHYRGRER